MTLCPDCPAARAARAMLFHDGVWTNLWFAILPFALVALVVAIVLHRVRRHDG